MSATEEFNKLVNNRDPITSHPEDHNSYSDSDPHFSDQEASYSQNNDSSDEDNMVSSRAPVCHVPKAIYGANTGPKGVIADAQAFEYARKKSFRRTLLGSNSSSLGKPPRDSSPTDKSSSTDEEDDNDEARFLRKWRRSRMQSLQNLQRKDRRSSPRGRRFGSVETVDAQGYLNAIERVTSDTVVVVCIYDESNDSAIVEACLSTIAERQPTTRFVKMHRDIADTEHIGAPAILAYRDENVFATIDDILENIHRKRSCSADSLEDLLKLHRVL